MQFPRINTAITLTIMYYDKREIIRGVGEISGLLQRAGLTFYGKDLPHQGRLQWQQG
jgi:hypothetical protein